MTHIEQAIRDAAERGGYGYRWYKANDLPFGEGYNALPMLDLSEHFMRPNFWRCLGKARGWDRNFSINETVIAPHGIGKLTFYERNGKAKVRYAEGGLNKYEPHEIHKVARNDNWWRDVWHGFIDHLADGKDAESFFASLV